MTKQNVKELTVKEGRDTADQYPIGSKNWCRDQVRTRRGQEHPYTCTREAHSDGPHVAHGPGGSAVATW